MNLTNDQRFAADNLLAAQERRGLHLESIPAPRLAVVMQVLAARKVELFNARYSVGAPVMYIPGVGKKPRRERVYRAARVENGRAIVELAGTLLPIDVDQCFTVGDEGTPAERAPRCLPAWQIAAAVAAGFVLAVIVALLVPSAEAVSPERIVIDCYAPDEAPGAIAVQSNRRRT